MNDARPALWVLSTLLALPAAAQAPEVALLSDLQGRVEVRAEAAWAPGRLDQGLGIGDGVRTHAQSTAEIQFVDGTVLMLTERTRIRITTALFNPADAPVTTQIALAAGGVDVRAGRLPLRVTADGSPPVDVPPGGAAHVELPGPGAVLTAGAPTERVSVDVAPPPPVRSGPVALPLPGSVPAAGPTLVVPGAAAAGTIEVGGGGQVVIPDLPAPADASADVPATRVRVRVRVRTP
ncbi:MAG: hypothetical protein R3F60_29640 [bacterium]